MPSKWRALPGFCFAWFNFPHTDLDSVSLSTMAGRWNLLILGKSHLSSICTVVGVENHVCVWKVWKCPALPGEKLTGCSRKLLTRSIYICVCVLLEPTITFRQKHRRCVQSGAIYHFSIDIAMCTWAMFTSQDMQYHVWQIISNLSWSNIFVLL